MLCAVSNDWKETDFMNHVERFRAVMNFQPVDRYPRWEWAMWWDETIARWHGEGLPKNLPFNDVFGIAQYFGLDPYQQFWFSTTEATIDATQHHVEGIVANMDDYLRVKPRLFPNHAQAIDTMRPWATVLCLSLPKSIPGIFMSSVNTALPRALSAPFTRGRLLPMTLNC